MKTRRQQQGSTAASAMDSMANSVQQMTQIKENQKGETNKNSLRSTRLKQSNSDDKCEVPGKTGFVTVSSRRIKSPLALTQISGVNFQNGFTKLTRTTRKREEPSTYKQSKRRRVDWGADANVDLNKSIEDKDKKTIKKEVDKNESTEKIKSTTAIDDSDNDNSNRKSNDNSNNESDVKTEPEESVKEDSDLSDNENDESINYINLREANMKANEEFFAKLGMDEAKNQLHQSSSKHSNKYAPTSRGLKIKKEPPVVPQITRRSLRQKRIDPEGIALPDPEPASSHEEDVYRLPDGPVLFKDCMYSKAANQTEEDVEKFSSMICGDKSTIVPSKLSHDHQTLKKNLDKININESRVAKLVPSRVLSLCWHPSTSVMMTAAGDKWGHVGLWKVPSSEKEDSSVVTFKPHIKPVSDLNFDASRNKLFSCSYDATLRCGDFEKGVFDEIFSMPVENDDLLRNFDFIDSGNTMLVSHFRGLVSLVDIRTPGTNAEKSFNIARKSLRTVSLHPITKHHFITAGVEAQINLWDLRNLSEKNPKPLQTLSHHSRAIASAYFSPNGAKIVSSSVDDKIAVCNVSEGVKIELSKVINHNNHTGRWLTAFRPRWHPVVEDAFITGSMSRPRQIEIYSAKGSIIKTLQNEDCLGSVCSLNEFHPNLECAVVGANSSGRLHVFM